MNKIGIKAYDIILLDQDVCNNGNGYFIETLNKWHIPYVILPNKKNTKLITTNKITKIVNEKLLQQIA